MVRLRSGEMMHDWDLTHLHPQTVTPRAGDLLAVSTDCSLWRPRTWFAWRIQATTRSPWNHVAILAPDAATGGWLVVEAVTKGGVVKTPLRAWRRAVRGTVALGRVKCPTKYAESAARWAESMVGRPYDWRLILQIRALQLVLGHTLVDRLQLPARFDANANDLLICSELAIAGYRQSGWPLADVGPFAGPGAVTASPDVLLFPFPLLSQIPVLPPRPGQVSRKTRISRPEEG